MNLLLYEKDHLKLKYFKYNKIKNKIFLDALFKSAARGFRKTKNEMPPIRIIISILSNILNYNH